MKQKQNLFAVANPHCCLAGIAITQAKCFLAEKIQAWNHKILSVPSLLPISFTHVPKQTTLQIACLHKCPQLVVMVSGSFL